MKLKRFLLLLVFFSLVFLIGRNTPEMTFAKTEKLVVEFENEFNYSRDSTLKWEKSLYGINGAIEIAKSLAQKGNNKGYEPLEIMVRKLTYREETESTYEKIYETLGYLGKSDERAVKLLLSEFNPNEDPVRAMNILTGIKLTGHSKILTKCIEAMEPFFSKEEINARL